MAPILLKNIEIFLNYTIEYAFNWFFPLNWYFNKASLHLVGLCLFFLLNNTNSNAQNNPSELSKTYDYNALDFALQKYWKLDQPQDEAEWDKWWLAAQAKGDNTLAEKILSAYQGAKGQSDKISLWKATIAQNKGKYIDAKAWLEQISNNKDEKYYSLVSSILFSLKNDYDSPQNKIKTLKTPIPGQSRIKIAAFKNKIQYKVFNLPEKTGDTIFENNLQIGTDQIAMFNQSLMDYSKNEILNKVVFCSTEFDPNWRPPYAYSSKSRLYEASIIGEGAYVNVKPIPFSLGQYCDLSPSISPDGQYLYFSSDRPESVGGFDIYRSKNSQGFWLPPVRLDKTINTKGNELSPFFMNDQLYFSSDFHAGFGGLDIFSSQFSANEFQAPVNLGKPINTEKDEWSYTIDGPSLRGYWNSNRNPNQNCQIYFHQKKQKQIQFTVKDLETNLPIGGALIDLSRCNLPSQITDENGIYKLDLPDLIDGIVAIQRRGYSNIEIKLNAQELKSDFKTYDLRLRRSKKLDEGIVLDSLTSKPVHGAYVVAINTGDGEYDETYTDQEGKFRTWILPGYEHKIIISKTGYQRNLTRVRKSDEISNSFNKTIHLVPAQNVFIQEEVEKNTYLKEKTELQEAVQDSIEAASMLKNNMTRIDTSASEITFTSGKLIQVVTHLNENFKPEMANQFLDFGLVYFKQDAKYTRIYIEELPSSSNELPLLIQLRKNNYPDAFYYKILTPEKFIRLIPKMGKK